jgi:GntR family transcriptional regulator/MocR family aminotransferase
LQYNFKNILKSNGFGDKSDYKNIYINLYNALKSAILNRALDKDIKLPPSRVLAEDLKLSRSTVLKAYELLLLEKYISSVKGSGYYINSVNHKKLHYRLSSNSSNLKYPKLSKRGLSFKKNIDIRVKRPYAGVAFRPGLPPLDIFPIQIWKNLTNNYWKSIKSSQLSFSKTIGLDSLRSNISNYLKVYRNIYCDSEQIIITTGSLHALSLIGDALINKNDEIVMENPTYPLAFHLFESLKAKICSAPLDNEGIMLDNIVCTNPKFIYTTPSNQYPTGIKMSMTRRQNILNFASDKNAFIIEDDYDHEFSNWEKPFSSIFSLDKQERTIYLGTFNKLLFPSIRIGYMIVPNYLLDTIISLLQHSSRFVSPATQMILNDFIERDYLNRHLRKVIEISNERKKVFLDSFTSCFGEDIIFDSNNTGLHIIGNFKEQINDISISNYFREKNIFVHPYSNYFIDGEKENGIVMGYSSVNSKVIKETILKMKNYYKSFLEL